jgi:hypothetical protein
MTFWRRASLAFPVWSTPDYHPFVALLPWQIYQVLAFSQIFWRVRHRFLVALQLGEAFSFLPGTASSRWIHSSSWQSLY